MEIATILFCYNRTKYLKQIFDSIGRIDYAFVDYSDKQDEVVSQLNSENIIKREIRLGCANNIIIGVTQALQDYDAVIVLEDDLKYHKDFIPYMKYTLTKYKDSNCIGSVTGHYDKSRHSYCPSSTGWGTWKKVWMNIDWSWQEVDERFSAYRSDYPNMYRRGKEGLLDSWAIRFAYHCWINDLISLHPEKNMIKHLGINGSHVNLLSYLAVRKHFRKYLRPAYVVH